MLATDPPIVPSETVNNEPVWCSGVEPDAKAAILAAMSRPRHKRGRAPGEFTTERTRHLLNGEVQHD
jgi:hypothetical protein